ncbi:hypothetical protein RFI_11590 [Reticulomyxa filosa]|uniref:Uncharacterized protein n=1 Tax=Reticulomyxa filosa TaxID=46433 RepID=X6NHR2_RETFI|nr:hypothetical protein RFI_11590 [Reticulomyxa filosa]|eukprot:ETO25546.1 hypothetical protein RFI_11590 [Reticulomyxa filosa]
MAGKSAVQFTKFLKYFQNLKYGKIITTEVYCLNKKILMPMNVLSSKICANIMNLVQSCYSKEKQMLYSQRSHWRFSDKDKRYSDSLFWKICGLNICLFLTLGVVLYLFWDCSRGEIKNPQKNWKESNRNENVLKKYLANELPHLKEREIARQKEQSEMNSNSTKGLYHYIFDMNKLQTLYKEKSEMGGLYPDWGDKETIFVALCSYRDNQCKNTIINLFEQAKYPDRIRVGIFQQHNFSDTDCMDFDKLLDCDVLPGVFFFK